MVFVLLVSTYAAKEIPIIWLSTLGFIMVVVPLIATIAYRIVVKNGSTHQVHDRIRLLAGLILLANFFLVRVTNDHSLVEIADRFNIGYETNLGRYQDRYLDEEYEYVEYRSTDKMLDFLLNNIGLIALVLGLVAWSVIYALHPSQQLGRRLYNASRKTPQS